MAQRRMFSLKIVDTDKFLDMPVSTQLLYFHLSMRADDDGFIANPKKIQRITGCGDDDFKVLLSKQFIIPFESGICVIKDWKIHNYIQKDRYSKTLYEDERKQLEEIGSTYKIKGSNQMYTKCVQDGYAGKDRLGKDRLGKDRLVQEKNKSKPKDYFEVEEYARSIDFDLDGKYFFDYYETRGWELKKGQKVKDWKACVRTWGKNNFKSKKTFTKFTNQDIQKQKVEDWINGTVKKNNNSIRDGIIETNITKQEMFCTGNANAN